MKYVRTKYGIRDITGFVDKGSYWQNPNCGLDYIGKEHILKQADTIEDLMQVGDIVFYWYSNDDTEHCENIIRDWDIHRFKYTTLTRLLIPVNENDYKCVAKAESSFELISGRRYLVQKGVLKLV